MNYLLRFFSGSFPRFLSDKKFLKINQQFQTKSDGNHFLATFHIQINIVTPSNLNIFVESLETCSSLGKEKICLKIVCRLFDFSNKYLDFMFVGKCLGKMVQFPEKSLNFSLMDAPSQSQQTPKPKGLMNSIKFN
jgi:hypothetical protein